MKILIAEDDATSRFALASVLKKWGFDVVATCNGQEAWTALQQDDAPKLAILDWMMPELDGPEICRRLRSTGRHDTTYIIMLTALGQKDRIVEGLTAGADDYVVKPFSHNELRARVNAGKRIVDLQNELTRKISELQDALDHVKTLQGIIPICMHCHRIRDDQESWHRIDEYIRDHSDAEFSHGLCPECLEKYYPDSNA